MLGESGGTGGTGGDDDAPLIVVVGHRRSGLGLLQAMLDSHPELAVAPESPLVGALLTPPTPPPFDWREALDDLYADRRLAAWAVPRREVERSLIEHGASGTAQLARRILRLWLAARGKRRLGLVASAQTTQVGVLASALPGSRIVHVVRDGRDVAASVLEQGWVDTIERAALDWRRQVRRAHHVGQRLGASRYYELRYEDLVREPDVSLRLVGHAVDLRYHPAMLDYQARAAAIRKAGGRPHENRFVTHRLMPGLRDWRRDLPARAVDRFEALAGDQLIALGYELRSSRRLFGPHLATRVYWLRWHRDQLRG